MSFRHAVVLVGFCLLAACVQAAELPSCRFFSEVGEDTTYFRLTLPDEFVSGTRTKTLVRLTALSPEVFLVYPREIRPYGRTSYFAGKYRGAGTFRFRVEALFHGPREVRAKTQALSLEFPEKAPPLTDEMMRDFLGAQVHECERILKRDPHNAFYQYVRFQAPKRGNIEALERRLPPGRWRRVLEREVDMFSITTGALAIQESLQLEEMTDAGARDDAQPAVLISSLKGPEIRSHPFKEMLRGRTPHCADAARLVPQDFYYAHFNTLEDFSRLMDFCHAWGGHFLRTYAVSGRDDRLKEKVQKQLLISLSPATRVLLGKAIRDVTITGSDPFFLSGTDVTVLFRMAAVPLLKAYRAQTVAEANKTHPGLVRESFEYRGTTVSSAYLPSGEVRSFFTTVENWAIFSNTRRAMERILDVAVSDAPALADAADFQYMRTVFPGPADPAGENAESGFLYLSDTHIRHLVGPELKIRELRRMRCVNHLKMIEHAAMLFRIETQRKPKSLDDLAARRYIDADWLQCPDGGAYALQPQGYMATCAVHNRLRFLTPNIARALKVVTKREADDYRNFVRMYNNYWRTYFDPIGVRIVARKNVSFEVCILPLIENSIYNNLKEFCGGKPVNLAGPIIAPGTVISAVARINHETWFEQSDMLRMLDDRMGDSAAEALTRALGHTFAFALMDAEPIISFDANSFLGQVIRWRLDDAFIWLPILGGVNLPAYVAIEVEDRAAFRGFLSGLETFLAERAAEPRAGRFSLQCDYYKLPEYRGHRIAVVGVEFLALKARFFYSLVDGYLYVANRGNILRRIVDVAAGERKQPADFGHLAFSFHCDQWKRILPHLELRWEEKSRQTCFSNFGFLNVLFQAREPHQDINDFSWNADGRVYSCPDGGKYEFQNGEVVCSRHGDIGAPLQDTAPPAGNRFAMLLKNLRFITVTLRFTPEGLMTRLEVERE